MAVDPGTLAVKAALMAASMALNSLRKIEGPRLESRDVAVAEYGTPLPRLWGSGVLPFHYIWAKELREEHTQSKTKGGKYGEWSYYLTAAAQPCENQLEAIAKLWMDNKLVVQRTAVGPVSLLGAVRTEEGSERISGALATYLGDQTQPDPTYEAWGEDKYGAGSVPAFKGWPYIVLNDLPVEVFGNRPPQIKGLCIAAAAPNYLYEQTDCPFSTASGHLSPDKSRIVFIANAGFEIWDVASRTKLVSHTETMGAVGVVAVNNDGSFYMRVSDLVLVQESGAQTVIVSNSVIPGGSGGNVYSAGGNLYLASAANRISLVAADTITTVDIGFAGRYYFEDVDGQAWVVGAVDDNSGFGVAKAPDGTEEHLFAASTGAAYAMDNGEGGFVVWQNDLLYLVDKDTWTITAGPVAAGLISTNEEVAFKGVLPGDPLIWIGVNEFSTSDLSLNRTIDPTDWVGETLNEPIYDRISDALWSYSTIAEHVTIRYLDRVTEGDVTLASITTDVCNLRGVTDIDVTDLGAISIKGWFANMGSGSEHLQPLYDMHDVDPVPHDFGLLFRERGDAATDIIQSSEIVKGDTRWSAPIIQDRDLPYSVSVTYADETKDHETNTVYVSRFGDTTLSEADKAIDMKTYLTNSGEAQPILERMFRRIWGERETPKFGLKLREARLEPGDVLELELDGVLGRHGRATRIVRSGVTIESEWVRDDPRFHDPSASVGPTMDAREEDVMFYPTPSKAFVLDIPYTRDSENATNPQLGYAAGGYTTGSWLGAAFWEVEGGEYTVWNTVTGEDQATWGYAEGALAEPYTAWLWDRGSTLDVLIFGGRTLTSSTEAAINADPTINQAVLQNGSDWEIINFADVELLETVNGNNRYRLSTLKRGRRGTEWAMDAHAAGDAFLLTDDIQREELGLSDVGTDFDIRGQSIGLSPYNATDIAPVYAANDLKPRAPVIWHVTKESNGDLTIELRSRTRVGGNWNGSAISTGETAESYEFDVYDGATYKRTLASATKSLTYASADQTTDHGAEISAAGLEGNAYQLSATVGRGFARAA